MVLIFLHAFLCVPYYASKQFGLFFPDFVASLSFVSDSVLKAKPIS